MAPNANTLRVVLAVTATLLLGVVSPILQKLLMSTRSVGATGEEEPFQDAWFATLTMFLGMALALPADRLLSARRARAAAAASTREINAAVPAQRPAAKQGQQGHGRISPLFAPASLDLISTTINCIALLYLPVSIWQMLRGSEIVFSALLSIPLLGKRLEWHHWAGVLLCTAGVACAGLAKVLDLPSGDGIGVARREVAFSIFLVLLSQVFEALECICEEHVLRKVGLPPMQVTGVEGLWGVALTLLVYAASYFVRGPCGCGRLDSPSLDQLLAQPTNTALMLWHSATLSLVALAYLLTVGAFNVARINVIDLLSGVQSVMLSSLRMIGVWLFDLLLHYAIAPGSDDGEAWTGHSYLEVLALILLVVGQFAYAGWLRWPLASRSKGSDAAADDGVAPPGPKQAGSDVVSTTENSRVSEQPACIEGEPTGVV